MIEDYLNKFELEFPVYEAIQNDAVYYRKKSILKQMVEAANSYKNTPPCPPNQEIKMTSYLRPKPSNLKDIIKK